MYKLCDIFKKIKYMSEIWHIYLMALMYVAAGVMHFLKPRMYERIMPRYLPAPAFFDDSI